NDLLDGGAMKFFLLTIAMLFTTPLLWNVPAFADTPAVCYHRLKTISLGAAEGGGEYFDYITFDKNGRRIFLSHGTEFMVLDADTDKVLGTIRGLKRCHGIALVDELGKGFITDGDAGTVVVVDLKTLQKTSIIKAAPDADAILYDPASKH